MLYGMLGVLLLWVIGVYTERGSNTLVRLGLLLSSKKEHLFTIPLADTGMSARTLGALFGVMLTVGGIVALVSLIQRQDPDYVEPPPPPASHSMRDMGMGFGGGMGMDPMMGMGGPSGGFGGPPMGGPPGGFGSSSGGFGGPPF